MKKRFDRDDRGVALLMVLMIIMGLLILGQAAMLILDQVALRSGVYRRQEAGAYCAEEGLNLGRAWVLRTMGNQSQLSPYILNQFFADPTDPTSTSTRGMGTMDLCASYLANPQAVLGIPSPVYTLAGLCRTDSSGNPIYRINLIDDIDEPVGQQLNPFADKNNVFIIRSECVASTATVRPADTLNMEDVALVEVNQSGVSSCPNGNDVKSTSPGTCNSS